MDRRGFLGLLAGAVVAAKAGITNLAGTPAKAVETVPAMLAPGERVLTRSEMATVGRNKYTNSRTWVTGEVITAAQFNRHIRDNMMTLNTMEASAWKR